MKPDKLIRRIDEQGIIYTSEDGKIFINGEFEIPFDLLRRKTKLYIPKEWMVLAREWWNYLGFEKRRVLIDEIYDVETRMDCKFDKYFYLNVEDRVIFSLWSKNDFPILQITYPYKKS